LRYANFTKEPGGKLHGDRRIAALLCTAPSTLFVWQVHTEESAATGADSASPATSIPAYQSQPAETPHPEPVVHVIRAELADPSLSKGADVEDLALLQAFYAARTGGPLWTTDIGFSARVQRAHFEIGKADDWGLDVKAFDLPPAAALPKTAKEQAAAEVKLDLAILKYVRFARGGRLNPSEVSDLFDQDPPVRRDRRR
jgi:L,D-transpeptidase YcbB